MSQLLPEPSMGQAAQPTRQSEVSRELEALSRAASEVHDRVNILLDRLQPVLRNEPESPDKVLEPVGPPVAAPVALAIRQVSEELGTITRKLALVTSRLEV